MSQKKYKYCGILNELQRWPAYGKSSVGWGIANHFKQVCKRMKRRVMKDAVKKTHRGVQHTQQDAEEAQVSIEEIDL